MGRGRPVHLELGLAADLVDRGLIGELSYELICLNVDILLAWGRLWGLHIPGEELLCSFGSLLLQTLGVVFALVGLEKLVGVCASWDYHGGVGASAEHTLVMHDVLGEVLLSVSVSIRVLILLFLSDYSGVRGESLRATAGRLLHHF